MKWKEFVAQNRERLVFRIQPRTIRERGLDLLRAQMLFTFQSSHSSSLSRKRRTMHTMHL